MGAEETNARLWTGLKGEMTSKPETIQGLSDPLVNGLEKYANATRELLTDRNLTGEELRLLLFIMTHDLPDGRNNGRRKGFVYLSRATLASNFKRCTRQISTLVSSLETKGYIRREFRKGLVNVVHLLNGTSVEDDTLAENLQGSDSLPLQESFNTPLKKTCKGPLQKTFNQKNRIEDKKEKTRKKTSRPSHQNTKQHPMTRGEVEQAINGLDLTKFTGKYTDLDVPAEFEAFKDYYLGKNDPKTGQPNWTKWNDWNRAFHTWLRNARKFKSREQASAGPMTGHIPESKNPAFRRFEE